MSYRNLASVELPQETTIELTMEEKNKYISSVLTNARELAEKEEFWRELREEAQKLALAEEQRENERAMEEENKRRKEERELAEKEEFWRELREEAQNLVLAEEQRENKQKRSKIQALDPSSLAKLIHYIHKQKQKQDKSFLHIIKDIDTDLTDFITAIYSPDIKFNNKQFNNEHYRTFNNTITNTITDISDKITASKNIAGYKRKSKHYKSKHYKSKHYKNTNRKTNKNTNRKKNAQFRRTIRRLNKKTKNM
jgi:hypothetical protein